MATLTRNDSDTVHRFPHPMDAGACLLVSVGEFVGTSGGRRRYRYTISEERGGKVREIETGTDYSPSPMDAADGLLSACSIVVLCHAPHDPESGIYRDRDLIPRTSAERRAAAFWTVHGEAYANEARDAEDAVSQEEDGPAELGSISSGTLRIPDLLEAYGETLHRFDVSEVRRLFLEAGAVLPGWRGLEEWADENPEDAVYLLEELAERLEEFAPLGAYFGSHPGDGAEFGYWVDPEWIEDAKAGAFPDVRTDRAAHWACFLEINERGNVTLWGPELDQDGRRPELWAIV